MSAQVVLMLGDGHDGANVGEAKEQGSGDTVGV
jgi:hypothetical protein